jgi:hypothetical protein
VAQEQDWVDRLVDRVGEWLDSLSENNETQNLGEWSQSLQEKRQREKETTST